MAHKKFSEDDIFVSRVKAHPKYTFFVHSGSVYMNNRLHISGVVGPGPIPTAKVHHNLENSTVPMSLNSLGGIYGAELEHDSYRNVFKKDVINLLGKPSSGSSFNPAIGDTLSNFYPLSSSIYRSY